MNHYAKAIDVFVKIETAHEAIAIIREILKHNPSAIARAWESLHSTGNNAERAKQDVVFLQIAMGADGGKIKAIKAHRTLYGSDLKSAKEYIESLMMKSAQE